MATGSFDLNAEKADVARLLAKWQLFCDEDFPVSDDSLHEDSKGQTIKWKRPHELSDSPRLFVDGASRCDVSQGALGDCWFLSACASVAQKKDLIEQVIPPGQVLYGEGYTGLITVRFWRMGVWVSLHIDDRLPVSPYSNELLYGRCTDPNEFWLPLLEKAFAKFHGNYQYIDGGMLVEGFINLTGFITESVSLKDWPKNEVFRLLNVEAEHGSLLTTSRDDKEKQGLVGNHAYTVTGLKRLRTDKEGLVRLVRVRNTWGNTEWTGAWNDRDTRWTDLEESIKKQLDYTCNDDGEFWMKLAHFVVLFEEVTIATKLPDFDDEYDGDPVKQLFVMHNQWTKGVNAGGSQNDMQRFATNPQYLLTVKETDDAVIKPTDESEEDNEIEGEGAKCNVMVELIQEQNRKKFPELNHLGIHIYKTTNPDKRLSANQLLELAEEEGSEDHIPGSSVVCRLAMDPGTYVIVPSTFEPDQNRKFLLRVYSRKPIMLKELP